MARIAAHSKIFVREKQPTFLKAFWRGQLLLGARTRSLLLDLPYVTLQALVKGTFTSTQPLENFVSPA